MPVTNWPLTVIVSATASPMVVLPVLVSVVNVPAAAAVPPMAGGLARYVLNPVPETVLLALNVVNAPAADASPATCNAHPIGKTHGSGGSASHRHAAAGVRGVEQHRQ